MKRLAGSLLFVKLFKHVANQVSNSQTQQIRKSLGTIILNGTNGKNKI